MIVIQGGVAYKASDGVMRLVATLDSPLHLLAVLVVVPGFVREFVYNIVARYRYRVFGKASECIRPSPSLKSKFVADGMA